MDSRAICITTFIRRTLCPKNVTTAVLLYFFFYRTLWSTELLMFHRLADKQKTFTFTRDAGWRRTAPDQKSVLISPLFSRNWCHYRHTAILLFKNSRCACHRYERPVWPHRVATELPYFQHIYEIHARGWWEFNNIEKDKNCFILNKRYKKLSVDKKWTGNKVYLY